MPTGAPATRSGAQRGAVSDRNKALRRKKAESLNLLLLKVGAKIGGAALAGGAGGTGPWQSLRPGAAAPLVLHVVLPSSPQLCCTALPPR